MGKLMVKESRLEVRIAENEMDILASRRLRYNVFVKELGAKGSGIDHQNKIEVDRFDPYVDNLILVDPNRNNDDLDHVVGVYRLMTSSVARSGLGFYSQSEFDLAPLINSGRPLVELGRSCVHPDYRGGASMFHLFNGVADYVLDRGIEIMFGVASFHGTDIKRLLTPLSYLHCYYLAPENLRVESVQHQIESYEFLPCDQIDQVESKKLIPPLIKSYLRIGGFIGKGAYFDFDFNSTDLCLIVDTHNMVKARRDRYVRTRGTAGKK